MHLAAAAGRVDVVKLLLSMGGMSNTKDRWGTVKTPDPPPTTNHRNYCYLRVFPFVFCYAVLAYFFGTNLST